MGWNDRMLEDPFIPSAEYYQAKAEYEAREEYEAYLKQEQGLSSQNIDPATLTTHTQKERPERQGFLSRLTARFFGNQDHQKHTEQKQRENEVLPF